jgi:type VI secretion system secreted protein Hcp
MPIYMDYPDIKGSSTTDGFKDKILLDSFSLGVTRNIALALRTDKHREASEPSVSECTVTKTMDVASPKLFVESVASDLKNDVTITFTTTTAKKVTEFLSYKLANVGLSHYSVSAGANDPPTETLVLNFTKLEMKFTNHGPDVSGSPESVGYDLTAMKTV